MATSERLLRKLYALPDYLIYVALIGGLVVLICPHPMVARHIHAPEMHGTILLPHLQNFGSYWILSIHAYQTLVLGPCWICSPCWAYLVEYQRLLNHCRFLGSLLS
jgi:hypothetical protein